MSKILLHIDIDMQLPNRIFKDSTNKVSQITDKAQNIAFVQTDVNKQPTFEYGKGVRFDGEKPLVWASGAYDQQLEFFILQFQIEFKSIDYGNRYLMFFRDTVYGYLGLRYGTTLEFNLGTFSHIFSFSSGVIDRLDVPIKVMLGKLPYTSVDGIIYSANYFAAIDGVVQYYIFSTDSNKIRITNNLQIFGWDGFNSYGEAIMDNFQIHSIDSSFRILKNDIPKLYKEKFTHFKRYKADGLKEFFLSSKFLDGVIIDVNDNITSIKCSIGTDVFTYSTNKPKWTKTGLLFAGGQVLQSTNTYSFGISDFFIGFWANPTADAVILRFGTDIKIGKDSTNDYFETNLIKTYASQTLTGYKYYCFIRISGTLFLLINGQTQAIKVESIDYSTPLMAIIGGTFAGLFDEPLLAVGDSIIDPTGYAVGNKVFEPPMRGQFDGTIKQFPIP